MRRIALWLRNLGEPPRRRFFFEVPSGVTVAETKRRIWQAGRRVRQQSAERWKWVFGHLSFVKAKLKTFKENIDMIRATKKFDFSGMETVSVLARVALEKCQGARKIANN